jgi:glutamate synthase (NADPH) small chain
MPCLTIDGQSVDVPAGTSLMAAAKRLGIAIPGLCHVDGLPPLTSCMVCVVQDVNSGHTFPSCSTSAEDGMVIETDNEVIRDARREVLQLLLSEHVGDCEAPCRRICPASLDVPLMMRKIMAGDMEAAARLAKEALVLPATLGWVCSAPCERGCHRGAYDEPLMIRDLHRRLAEQAMDDDTTERDKRPRPTGKRVAIVGAGPTGLAAARVLLQLGHGCRLFDKADRAGGPLRELGEEQLPRAVFEAEVAGILRLGAELETHCEIGEDLALEDVRSQFDAVLLTCDDLDDDEDGVFMSMETSMTVNAVADGKSAALEIDCFLRGLPVEKAKKEFDCRLGSLEDGEKAEFAVNRADPATLAQGRQADDMEAEAGRCLHCDCMKVVSCKLREYATQYGARQFVYPGAERQQITAMMQSDEIVYEPGKCIKCGLCVEIAVQRGEPLGMAFMQRGFDTHVRVPFDQSLAEGLGASGRECAEACPTGALSVRNGEEREPCE